MKTLRDKVIAHNESFREKSNSSEAIKQASEDIPNEEINEVILDISGKANGRGAYIYMNEEAIQKAKKTNCLGKALECEIPETIYERMSKYLKMK